MPTKVWYEPDQRFYVVEFVDDPVFDLPEWAVGKEEHWSRISYHLFAANVDNKILFHRLAIEREHLPGETLRDDLERKLTWLIGELRYTGQPPPEYNPTGFVSWPCLRAAEILEAEHKALLDRLVAAAPDM
ncbi:MAG: hypothetical protein ACRYFS_12920 [Janthinobacterium lividum]